MAERQLQQILTQLKSQQLAYADAAKLLSKAKLLLLQLGALTPKTTTTTSSSTSSGKGKSSSSGGASPSAAQPAPARGTYEQGALYSIRAKNADGFTRYVQQLSPLYELPANVLPPNLPERNKVTGLYLLLLLTQGRYAEFHSELEALSTREGGGGSVDVEGDRYLGYPIRLERWLMEGSYDRVWKAMKKGEVPCEEYGVFSEILTIQIRAEIASSSERAYPSLPISSTKSLLFLESEGAVVEFAKRRGWTVRDGHIYFPTAGAEDGEPEKPVSLSFIENTLGYARELETIV